MIMCHDGFSNSSATCWVAIAVLCAALPAVAQSQGSNRNADTVSIHATIENVGQWDSAISFGAVSESGSRFAVKGDRLVMGSPTDKGSAPLSFVMCDADSAGPWTGIKPSAGVFNFFVGNDPGRWKSGARGFAAVQRVDTAGNLVMRIAGTAYGAQVTWRLRGSARHDGVRLRLEGASRTSIEADGTLALECPSGVMRLRPPAGVGVRSSGEHGEVAATWSVDEHHEILLVPGSSSDQEVLDMSTSLEWAGLIGGSEGEVADGVAFAANGDVILGGVTFSMDFPATAGAFDTEANTSSAAGNQVQDVFVCRLADGLELVYATFLGGMAGERTTGLAVDDGDRITLTGTTGSLDFPTTAGAFSTVKHGPVGAVDAFVTRLSADGTSLVYSTFLGGNHSDDPSGVIVYPDGSAIIGGATDSNDFPGAPPVIGGVAKDAFVTRLLPDGSALAFTTLLGGSSTESVAAVTARPGLGIAICGSSSSEDFPFTPPAYEAKPKKAWVAHLDEVTGAVTAATSLSGTLSATLQSMGMDAFGNVYVGGTTTTPDLPITPGAFQPNVSPGITADAFLTCFDPRLTKVLHSTYFGGPGGHDMIKSVVVSDAGLVTIAGITRSPLLPVTPGALKTALGLADPADAFVARLNRELTVLHYSSYIGGSKTEDLTLGIPALDVAPDGRVVIAVGTTSPDFPVTPGTQPQPLKGETDVGVIVMRLLPTGVEHVGASTPGCAGPLTLGVTAMPQVGNETFALTCTGAPPSSQRGLLLFALDVANAPFKLAGADLWLDKATLLSIAPIASDEYGYVELPLRLPDDPAAAGMQAAVQILWREECPSPGLSASDALVLTLQP